MPRWPSSPRCAVATRPGEGARISLALEDVALATAGNLGLLTEPQVIGTQRERLGNAIYGQYGQDFTSRDGAAFMVVLLTGRHFRDLVDVTGTGAAVAALADALGADFSTEGDRYRYRDVLSGLFATWFGDHTADEVTAALSDTTVLFERYRTFAEVAQGPKVTANPLFSRLHQPGLGDYLAPAMPAAFDGVHPASGPAPALGQDTADVLTECLGLTANDITRLLGANTIRRTAMTKLAQTLGLTEFQTEIIATVRQFVDKEVIPHAAELERADSYPQDIVDQMRDMGLFGLMIPQEYGGLGESLLTYALCVEELARGWMSVSGVLNTHFIVAYMLRQHGTDEQKQRFLPRMATGETRGAFSMSEPELGSDVAAIRTRAQRNPDGTYTINGQKMWVTNGGSSTLVAVLVRTDEGADKPHRNLTAFLVEKPTGFGEVAPGLVIPGKIDKLGYKGIDTTELIFDGYQAGADDVLGGTPGQGFFQMMDGIEVGRVNVSARACGVGIRAFELAARYAQQRQTFGKPIAEHQAIAFQLAEMATKVEAAHLMMVNAARLKDSGERNDVAAGMAKYLASEFCSEVTQQSFRIHGGYGYSKEYEIERLMRDAPFLLIGEGTSEIQKQIISKRLLAEYRI